MITCDQSDYLEIACLYRIPIALNWPDGRRVEGIPLDTGYNEHREEC
ncbi:MAG: transcriptional antiterminator, partial [Pseudomonas formosensis]|nr:transcriptional antiterminator [Halopseudomonas formosensis]